MCWLHLFMHFILELDGLAFVRSDRGGISHVAHPPFPFCRRKRVAICPLHKNPFRLFPRVACVDGGKSQQHVSLQSFPSACGILVESNQQTSAT